MQPTLRQTPPIFENFSINATLSPKSAARNAAIVYEELHDKGFDPFQTLNLANVYLKSGKLTAACKYFENVKKQAETDPNKDKYSLFNHVELLKPSFEEQCEI